MGVLRPAVTPSDLTVFVFGAGAVVAAALFSASHGAFFGLGALLALLFFTATVTCFLVAPQVAVAVAIPLFAIIPAAKVFVTLWAGPVKDVVTIAAAFAVAIRVLQREGRKTAARTDTAILLAIGLYLGLYVLNVGGAVSGIGFGVGWIQGVRLVSEPLILLLAGLLLPNPRRTLRWGAASFIASGCAVAFFGIVQQLLGPARLVSLGYSYSSQVRMAHGYLRAFGTLDDPFTYAAFLLLALATVMFWMRRRNLALACGVLITIGIAVSLVQTAALVIGALLAVVLVRAGRTAVGLVLMLAMIASGLAIVLGSSSATQTRSVVVGPNNYLTLNGRTTVWKTVFADPARLPLGLGVGKVGTAAMRASIGVTSVEGSPNAAKSSVAVDSGYFATVADVGLLGLAVLLFLLGRLFAVARAASKHPADVVGWLALAYLTVMAIDAFTRDSFTGFPGAFLGLLMVGSALAVARDDSGSQLTPAIARD